jgi:hypothetical protein
MPGASKNTCPVKIMNANWKSGRNGDDGHFELMLITSDEQQHILEPSPVAMTALVALAQADTVLVWDRTTAHSSPQIFAARCLGPSTSTRRNHVPRIRVAAWCADDTDRSESPSAMRSKGFSRDASTSSTKQMSPLWRRTR